MNTPERARSKRNILLSTTRLSALLLAGSACALSAASPAQAAGKARRASKVGKEPTKARLRAQARAQRWSGGYGFPAQKIQAVQFLLRAWGLKSVEATGQWDQPTLKALDRFSRARGLGDKASPLNAQRYGSLIVPLSAGARNDGVRALQSLLRERGYDVPVDGNFTPTLKLTLIKAQSLWGLRPPGAARAKGAPGPSQAPRRDGIMDAATWAELFAPGWQAQGYPIEALQCLLRAKGSKIKVTGTLDGDTLAALSGLQRSSGLVQATELNAPTLRALSVDVRPKTESDAVRALQVLVRALQDGPAAKRLRPGGVYDEGTARALRQVAPRAARGASVVFEDWFELFDKVANRAADPQ